MYLTQNELAQAKEICRSLNENSIIYNISEALLGDRATPESIFILSEQISHFNEDAEEDNGASLIKSAFGCDTKTAHSFLQDSKRAGICLRALRDKYEDIYFKSQRARAEDRGFFSTILYTIKRAIYWIIKKFQDLKDSVVDIIKDRPEYSSRTKRDYLWLRDQEDNWLAHNTYWYNNSEY